MMDEKFSFKEGLYTISMKLTGSDVNKMKFILSDFLPRQQLEKAQSGFDVLCLMATRSDLLSPKDCSFLEEVLREVGKDQHVKEYLKVSFCSTPLTSPLDTASVPSHYQRPRVSGFKKFLSELADSLSSENIHDVGLFFADICKSINYQNIDDIKSAEVLFSKLQESHLIGASHLQPLQKILELIGRLDLVSSIESYNKGAWQSINSLSTPVENEGSVELWGGSSADMESLPDKDCSTTQQLLSTIDIQERTVQLQQEEIARLRHKLMEKEDFQDEDSREMRLLKEELSRKTSEVVSLSSSISQLQEQLWAKHDVPLYSMTRNPHGLAVVIVNGLFNSGPGMPPLKLRKGANKDRDCFKQTFEFLHYTVNIYSDLAAQQMRKLMITIGSHDHSEYDSFVCCVSSHGTQTGIYGSDSVLLKRSALIDPIKSCVSLKSKPKLFFFQACRVPVPEVVADSPGHSWAESNPSLHEDADILIANASTEGNPAFTSPETGSWFAKAVQMKLTAPQVHERTLQQLLEEVTDLVSTQEGQLPSGQTVNQCVEVTTRMRKGIKFFFAS